MALGGILLEGNVERQTLTRSHTKVVVGVYGELILARNQYSRRAEINLDKIQIISLTRPWYSIISSRVMLVVPKKPT